VFCAEDFTLLFEALVSPHFYFSFILFTPGTDLFVGLVVSAQSNFTVRHFLLRNSVHELSRVPVFKLLFPFYYNSAPSR